MYFTSFPTHFECIILYYIIHGKIQFKCLQYYILSPCNSVQAIQALLDSEWIWTVSNELWIKWIWFRVKQYKDRLNGQSIIVNSPESLNTSFLLLLFFQWLFLSSDSVCPFVLTPRDTTWACVAKDSSDGALCFRLCGHLVLVHLISCNHRWLPQKMCVSV